MNVLRVFIEKKHCFDIEVPAILSTLKDYLGIEITSLRLFNRYDICGENSEQHEALSKNLNIIAETILGELPLDNFYYDELPKIQGAWFFPLTPAFDDQRSESAAVCIQMQTMVKKPKVQASRVFAVEGIKSDEEKERVKEYLKKTYGGHEGTLEKTLNLDTVFSVPSDIPIINNFRSFDKDALAKTLADYSLSMNTADMLCVQDYFIGEKRDPSLTELKVLDTYWSDHCRHTTFNTIIDSTDISDVRVKEAFDLFISVNKDRPVTLMNVATAAMRHLRDAGKLQMLYDSGENNACTIRINVDVNGSDEDWLLMFKNESHNHPTEIEPFDGASTCLGGAIRDPLSGRAYVYQAMRITGAGDPRTSLSDTLPGKLPQRIITTEAARGYSSYGNQVGLTAGFVKEIYHEKYIAKRMEVGALVGAVKLSNVRYEKPVAGDIVLLIGARTGRDGIGGASSSSTSKSSSKTEDYNGTVVPKGDALGGRKLVRLFNNPNAVDLIKRCNDFGAGGVSVAVGELCDGLLINLDAVPLKYEGLNGTEIAISESQERMAVIISSEDEATMKEFCQEEDLEATVIAQVTEAPRLIMNWHGKEIVNLSRDFLNMSGAERHTTATVPEYPVNEKDNSDTTLTARIKSLVKDLNFCSQKGLQGRFDGSSVRSVFMPTGGSEYLTETQVMAALIPVAGSNTASVMAYGFDPYKSTSDPFGGAVNAVVTSVAKLVASGADINTAHVSLQEFFPSPRDDSRRWGAPLASMLGAFWAQMGLNIAAIGGKDSCSGSFGEMDVPQTLISFAVAVSDAKTLISPEFKNAGSKVYLLEAPSELPKLRKAWEDFVSLVKAGKVLSAFACEKGGIHGSIIKMSFGNMIGFKGQAHDDLFATTVGSIVFEACDEMPQYKLLGYTEQKPELVFGDAVFTLEDLRREWEAPLESVFPTKTSSELTKDVPVINYSEKITPLRTSSAFARPRVVIPVFPGTSCEYDIEQAVLNAGGEPKLIIVRNSYLAESVEALEREIRGSQIMIIPGGFSGGDEPYGSGKFIASMFRSGELTDAINELLSKQDGLILGICNGFQALIKLGLVPYGRIITPQGQSVPTLTFNTIGRLQSRYVTTRVCSTKSPWLSLCNAGDLHTVPIAHGEGRFVASENELLQMKQNGQIAFQYCDREGKPSMDIEHNPSGSDWSIEGITSPDGRILGKMSHSERSGKHVAKNIPGNKMQPIFEGGISYFS